MKFERQTRGSEPLVRSIRHWGLMTGVLEEDQGRPNNQGRCPQPTALGKLVFGPRGGDPDLEEPGTLWVLHWNLAVSPLGPTTWFWTFNRLNEPEFTKERIIAGLRDLVEQYEWSRIADNSLFVDADYAGFDVRGSKRRSAAWLPLPDVDKSRIGRRGDWQAHVIPLLVGCPCSSRSVTIG